jgi:hypothetical protein
MKNNSATTKNKIKNIGLNCKCYVNKLRKLSSIIRNFGGIRESRDSNFWMQKKLDKRLKLDFKH